MTKDIKLTIINFLEIQKDSISINELSKQLQISYPTILKYCDILFAEGKVDVKDYGNIKLISKKQNESSTE